MNPEKITVAIVDDDEGVRRSLGFVLELEGFIVHQFESPAAFLAMLGEQKMDCLVVDFYMPETTGLTLSAQLREIGVQVPIILVTASHDPHIDEKAKQLGVHKVLRKPFTGDLLPQLIHAAIADRLH